jgi:hypothetical protein
MTVTRNRRLRRWVAGGVLAGSLAVGLATPGYAGIPANSVAAGTLLTTVDFGTAPIPAAVYTSPTLALNNACALPSWTMSDAGSVAAYVDDVGLFYAGPMAISGTGVSTCDRVSQGTGSFSVSTSGANTFGGKISCTGMNGFYSRIGVILEFGGSGAGTCTIDAQTVPIGFQGVGLVYPSGCGVAVGVNPINCPYGTGVNSSIQRVDVRGVWVGFA